MSTARCAEIGDELVAFLDGELAEEARRPVASHVGTCLVCRREVERLTLVRRWVSTLPAIEPTPALADGLWERIAAESTSAAVPIRPLRSTRSWTWAAPALAAAAVVALAFQSFLRAPEPLPPAAPKQLVAAPAPAPRKLVAPAVAAQPGRADTPQVASADALHPEDLRPEDLPPELLEHPELFLRLPVVRRLQTLEHIDAVRDSHGDEDGSG
jgi:hypothetical protein